MPRDGDDNKGRFDGITYLYIRTNPADTGMAPLPAGLPFWVSPDIAIIQPGGAESTVAIAGETNQVRVTVNNGGGIDAVDAYVEAFFADPSTAFTPATATLIGGGFLTIPGYSQAAISFPWTPGAADAGHRCLLARVALFIPPDSYANGAIFDVTGDRHVAQRNISVVELSASKSGDGMKMFSFAFALVNPLPEAAEFFLQARQIRPADEQQLQMLRGAVGCGFAQFTDKPVRAMRIDLGEEMPPRDLSEPEGQRGRPVMGLLPQPVQPGRGVKQVKMKPGEVRRAILTVAANPTARPGDLAVLEVTQMTARQEVVGGLWIVARH